MVRLRELGPLHQVGVERTGSDGAVLTARRGTCRRPRHHGPMTVMSALLAFSLVAGLLTITPGLDTALVLRAALSQGRGHAYATAAGICGGLLVWGVAAAIGVSTLLTASRSAYDGVRVVGAAYMVWLGIGMVRSARRTGGHNADVPAPTLMRWQGFRRGLLTNTLNPKIGAFYVAVLPQFLPGDVSAVAMGALLAAVHVLLSSAWFTVLVLAADKVRRFLTRPRAQRALDRGTGIVLIGFGMRLGLVR